MDATLPVRLPFQGGTASPLALVLVPGFSGAPWDTSAFGAWRSRILVTARLPDSRSIDACADAVEGWAAGLRGYALVGDTFGSLVTLAVARRQPRELRAIVLSDNCVSDGGPYGAGCPHPDGRGAGGMERWVDWYLGHMRSSFDPPTTHDEVRLLFRGSCDASPLARRLALAGGAAAGSHRGAIAVPTLVIAPEDAGPMARRPPGELINGGSETTRIVLAGTGPLMRLTHPDAYAATVATFLDRL